MASLFLSTAALLLPAAWAVENPVHAEIGQATVAPGGTAPLLVTVVIPEGYHVYRDVLEVKLVDAGRATMGAVDYPEGLHKPDPLTPSVTREVYEGDALVEVPFTVPADAAGDLAVRVEARFQACKDTLCFPTKEEELAGVLHVTGLPLVAGLIPTAAAQAPPAEEPAVLFSGAAGEPGKLTVHADLQGEWHINKMFVGVTLPEGSPYKLADLILPAGEKTGSEADGTAREDFTHDFDIIAPISGPDGAAEVEVDVAYQACKGVSLCRMPTSEKVKVPIVIGAASAAPAVPAPPPPATEKAAEAPAEVAPPPAPASTGGFGEAAKRGTGALLLFCFLAGIGVSFTPCVLPMVPITMGLIGARGTAGRLSAISKAGTYVLGQALVYTVLGVAAGVFGSLFGGQMSNPYIVGGIALFFVAMGFSMFGFFDVQVPGFLQSRISGFDERGSYYAAFVFGVIGAVLAGPCSGPVVAAILGVIAAQGQVLFGALLMFVFALGMGMIFLVTGAATGWLPQRGPWMVMVKKSFGVVMWLGAIYYAKSLFTDTQTAMLTAGVLLVTAVFGWPHADDGEGVMTVRLRQLYGIVAGVVGIYLVLGLLLTQGFILPPVRLATGSTATSTASIKWLRTEEEALAAARASGLPLMIDFTAEWCAACHEMERETYTDPRVIAAAGGFVTAMIDCTDEASPAIKAVQKKYGVTGLPTVVFAMPDGRILNSTVGFVEAGSFTAEMAKAQGAAG